MAQGAVSELYPVFRDEYGVMGMAKDDDSDAAMRARLEDLMRTPDFSAARANARLEIHEARCDERYAGILAALERAAVSAAALHSRIDKVSGRMWIAAATGLGMGVAAIAALLMLIITRGLK